MRPNDAFAAVASLLVPIIGKSYREQELTAEEWDRWTDAILLLAETEKNKLKENECPKT
jgi:hypothetical protein